MSLNDVNNAIFDLFEKYSLFRRLFVAYVGILVWHLALEAFEITKLAITHGSDLTALSLLMTTNLAPLTILLGFAGKLYFDYRKERE